MKCQSVHPIDDGTEALSESQNQILGRPWTGSGHVTGVINTVACTQLLMIACEGQPDI